MFELNSKAKMNPAGGCGGIGCGACAALRT
ncbi:hypothetical protein C8D74_101226 [Petrotoga sibirica]|uniref:Uncharacterized protein n=1 Tax=Petrotoga sibirica TaxID=156202 RepID=A0A4R8EY99_9BACT|nr:hypothetical protein C8D74_101226 [Petrotoga sibirica]